MSDIRLDTLGKSFGSTRVLQDVTMSIEAGEFVAVLGPSGCGKTTLLRCLAGFERLTEGTIAIGGSTVSTPKRHIPPEDRGVGVVFQNYALWPHMTVGQNVSYGLKIAGIAKSDRDARVAKVLDTVELGPLANRRPADLSGGQRQRVALARCLAMESRVVLLDEPLANLDVHLRGTLEEEFARFHKRSGATMFYITHDQSEALALADRVAVMDKGRILQFAAPRELYAEPANETVAGFIGEGTVTGVRNLCPMGGGRAQGELLGHIAPLRCAANQTALPRARITFHPGDLHMVPEQHGIEAHVVRATYRGAFLRTEVMAGPNADIPFTLNIPAPASLTQGQRISIALRDGWVLPEAA